MGRPKKIGGKVSGQLNKNECRFTFIIDKDLLSAFKADASIKKLTYKDYMHLILTKKLKFNSVKPKTNEALLKEYLKNKGKG